MFRWGRYRMDQKHWGQSHRRNWLNEPLQCFTGLREQREESLSERTNLQTETQESVYQQELVTAFRSDSLHLILLPTERCNFRCAYCYEDFAIGRMRPETVLAIKRLIDRRLEDLPIAFRIVVWRGADASPPSRRGRLGAHCSG